MLWFYVMQQNMQALCMTELTYFNDWSASMKKQGKEMERTPRNYIYDDQIIVKADLAVGFEHGIVKVFDLSHHFVNSKFDEVKQSFFTRDTRSMLGVD